MCNTYRITLKRGAKGLAQQVNEAAAKRVSNLVRKSDPGVVMRADGRVELMRWGFHRSFNPSINNARSDKLAGGMWREAFHGRRCVIPMSLFYEWGPGKDRARVRCLASPRSIPIRNLNFSEVASHLTQSFLICDMPPEIMKWTTILIIAAALAVILMLKRTGQISSIDAKEHLKQGALVIDVRSPGEFNSGHLTTAINIPLDVIVAAMPVRMPDRNQVLLLHCQSGMRSGVAVKKLKSLGYTNAFNLGSLSRARAIVDGVEGE